MAAFAVAVQRHHVGVGQDVALVSRMMPEPVPPSLPLVALMVTTLGDALTAAAVMALTISCVVDDHRSGLAACCRGAVPGGPSRGC